MLLQKIRDGVRSQRYDATNLEIDTALLDALKPANPLVRRPKWSLGKAHGGLVDLKDATDATVEAVIAALGGPKAKPQKAQADSQPVTEEKEEPCQAL